MNNEQDRITTCRAGKIIEFAWNGHNIVTARRVDLNIIVEPGLNLFPAFILHHFHCPDCSFLFDCTVENSLSETERIAIFEAGGSKAYRQDIFQNLTLKPNVNSPPRIK